MRMTTSAATAMLLVAIGSSISRAQCPTTLVAGGGPAATDCFVQFSGVASTKVTCTDGDPSCDTDGVADGTCTIGLHACLNCPSTSCTATPLDGPVTVTPASDAATALQTALASLDASAGGCTSSGIAVPLKITVAGIKPGKAKLALTASAGGKKDKDKLKITCVPSSTVPSLANDVQPIMTARCAVPQCHSGPAPSAGQSLEPGQTYQTDVNVHATDLPKLLRVKPGNLRASFLARKILGSSAIPQPGGGAEMPQGCPGVPPATVCLTDGELYTILAWIKGGAPNN